MTMAMAVKNANDRTLATFLANTIVWLGTNYLLYGENEALVTLFGWVVLVHCSPPSCTLIYIAGEVIHLFCYKAVTSLSHVTSRI